MAGFAFEPIQAKKLSRELSRLFDGRFFHAREFFHGRGDFGDLKPSERDAILKEMVKAIRKRFHLAVAITCNVSEIEPLAPKNLSGREHAYALCVQGCMLMLGKRVHAESRGNVVSYLFESGHSAEQTANIFASVFRDDPKGRDECAYYSHGFAPKEDSQLLQVADWFAWEWAKHFAESVEKDLRAPRKSLVALANDRRDQFVYAHVTGEELATRIGHYDEVWGRYKDRSRPK